jgi:hypothetical protein
VVIVREEMCRVLKYHAWKARDWRSKAQLRTEYNGKALGSRIRRGLLAYAERQACMWEDLAHKFVGEWWVFASENRMRSPDWPTEFLPCTGSFT